MQMYQMVHMPKTAGGSLKWCFKNVDIAWVGFSGDQFDLYTSKPWKRWILTHHLAYGLHKIFQVESNYITCLREPKERLLSEFVYHHSHNIPGVHIPERKMKKEFEQFVSRSNHLNVYSYNYSDYHYQLGSLEFDTHKASDNKYLFDRLWERAVKWDYMSDALPLNHYDPESLYKKAVHNLKNEFRVIGDFQDIDGFITKMEDFMATKLSPIGFINQTSNKISFSDLDKKVQIELAEKTKYDQMIYEEFCK